MKINPLNKIANKHNEQPERMQYTSVGNESESVSELYSSEDSAAIKCTFGAQVIDTKAKLLEEANELLDRRNKLFSYSFKKRKECERLVKDDYTIFETADNMYATAHQLYNEGSKPEYSKRNGYYKAMLGNRTNLSYYENGKLTKVMTNARPVGDGILADHEFQYLNGDVLYKKNSLTKDGETVSSDEEYYYLKGQLQKYKKGVKVDENSKHTDEIRTYTRGKPARIIQNIDETAEKTTIEKSYNFQRDELRTYVEDNVQAPDLNSSARIYGFVSNVLTNYKEDVRHAKNQGSNDFDDIVYHSVALEMDFRDDRLHEAIVNSKMNNAGDKTIEKRFHFFNNQPKKVVLDIESSPHGDETCKKEVTF